jgi:DNA repair photolyase
MGNCSLITKNLKAKTNIIYEPQGRAREYAELAANLYCGCDHGCVYCYAPLATRKSRDIFHNPSVRSNIIEKFWQDAIELERIGEKRTILLSFTTDPYQKLDKTEKLTRKAIEILHSCNLKVAILTKGGERSERDFDLLSQKSELSEYGATLVFINEDQRELIEPQAAPTLERIHSLKKAYDKGIQTYVSLEPVWESEQSLELIELTSDFVDFYKVGKLNYNIQQKNVNWKQFKTDVIKKLDELGKKYYIKKDLDKF